MNGAPYRSIAVANWFIQNSPGITPLKLQKLIYYAHGWHLAIHNGPLIDEVIQAWEFGPVVPQVYHEFKQFGSRPIPVGALGTIFEFSPTRKVRLVTPLIPPEDQKTHEFLKEILKVFGPYSAIQLSRATHQEGTPWAAIHAANPLRKGMEIPDREIKAYFENLAARSDARSS